MSDSTFSGNRTLGDHGAISTEGPVLLTNVTIAGNSSATGVAIGALGSGSFTMTNSIVDGGSCAGPVTSNGGNVEDGNTCGFNPTRDRANIDPKLGPLADNGGPTLTRALLSKSVAIGLGAGCFPTDQRSAPRKGRCDSGAYQLVTCRGVTANVLGSPFVDRLVGTARGDGILAFGGNDFVKGGGGNDAVCGGSGKDSIRGGPGNDQLAGELGNDNLLGAGGKDRLLGGPGSDRCRLGAGGGTKRGCER